MFENTVYNRVKAVSVAELEKIISDAIAARIGLQVNCAIRGMLTGEVMANQFWKMELELADPLGLEWGLNGLPPDDLSA